MASTNRVEIKFIFFIFFRWGRVLWEGKVLATGRSNKNNRSTNKRLATPQHSLSALQPYAALRHRRRSTSCLGRFRKN